MIKSVFIFFLMMTTIWTRKCPNLKSVDEDGVRGMIAHGYEPLAQVFYDNCVKNITLNSGLLNTKENGQVAVYHKRCLISHLWCGVINPLEQPQRPISANTLFNVYSVSKGVISAGFTLMEGRKYFNWDDKISKYWPAFKFNGKENITISQFLANSAGLSVLPLFSINDTRPDSNFTLIESLIQQQAPLWTPGTIYGYSPLVKGWIALLLSKYVDPHRRNLVDFINQELTPKLPYAEFYFSVLPNQTALQNRLAFVRQGLPPNFSDPTFLLFASLLQNPSSIQFRAFSNPPEVLIPNLVNTVNGRNSIAPATLLYTNALSLANLYDALISPTRKNLFKRSSVFEGAHLVHNCTDLVLLTNTTYTVNGLNKGIAFDNFPYDTTSVFGHPGTAGNYAFADPDRRIAFGYVTAVNSAGSSSDNTPYNTFSLVKTLYDLVEHDEDYDDDD